MYAFARRRTAALTEGALVAVLAAMIAGLTGMTSVTMASPHQQQGSSQALEGILAVRHGDNFATGAAVGHAYFLTGATGERQLTFRGNPPDDSLAGSRIRVHGTDQGAQFNVADGGVTQLATSTIAATGATGAKRVAVVLFNFSNDTSQPYTPSLAAGVAFTNPDSVAAYYAEGSWGQLTLSGDVYGWYTIPNTNANCAYSTWSNAASAAAASAGVDLSTYTNVVYAFPSTSCGWAGLASMPGTTSWLNGPAAMSLHVMAHELGHNFGTHHASQLNCIEGGVRVSLSATASNCTSGEYGDPYSVMGMATRYQHSNYAKGNLGWLAAGNTQLVTASGEYLLAPDEVQSLTAVTSVRIQRTTNTWFTLEFRQHYGTYFETFASTAPVVTGVTIRITSAYTTLSQSQLIDTTPGTTSFIDAPLATGQVFTDPLTGISIGTLGTSAAGALIRIDFGTGSTASPAPSATPTPTPMPTSSPIPSPTPPADTQAPTAPGNLGAVIGNGKKVGLSWNASSDNVGVAGYRVFRNGTQVGTTAGTSFSDTLNGKNPTATYYVVAFDAAGNLSPTSNQVPVT